MNTKNYIVREGKKLIKNKDVFLINNRWLNMEETVIDNFTKQRVAKKSAKVLQCYDANGKKVFSTKWIQTDAGYYCASVISDEKFRSNFKEHLFVDQYLSGRCVMPVDKSRNKSLYSYSQKTLPSLDIEKTQPFSKILESYTYGIEIETSNGEVSDAKLASLGFTTVYDGSIGGHELVSKPMVASELDNIRKLVDRLPYCCTINSSCSLHIHIGNIPRSENNLIALYDIYYKLQDELNLLIPYYKKEAKYLRSVEKDYVKSLIKLPKLDVNNIFTFFGLSGHRFNKVSELNSLIVNNQKWTLSGRYHFINFLNYICKPTGTIEIRTLQSTFNWKLIQTWLLIHTLIVDYALKNNIVGSKTKIELRDIIQSSKLEDNVKSVLINNIEAIKLTYFNHYVNRADYTRDLGQIDKVLESILIPYDNYVNTTNYNKLTSEDNNPGSRTRIRPESLDSMRTIPERYRVYRDLQQDVGGIIQILESESGVETIST
jgi:hypothetical protein